jgi:hypothetical protein
MALGETHNDPSGLGRWSSITLRGKEDHILTIFTAYRVCKGYIQSSPVGSSFSREYVHHKQNGHPNPQPRKTFLTDITNTIQNLQTKGHAILLMLDSNGTLNDDDDLQQLLLDCELSDLHEFAPSPSTYIGSQHRRIDHMLGCPQTLSALTASGSLSYAEGPQSDHRGLFVDLDTNSLLEQDNKSLSISPSASRSLKSGNPEAVATYHEAMLQYYADHQMETRLYAFIEAKDSLPTPTLRKLLETWDADQGRAMKHAETLLERPKKPYAWSPTLRNAGLLCRYWRLRRREKMRSENYNDRYYRLEHQTQQHDPTFILPFRGIPLSISEITQQVKDAKLALHSIQLSSSELRYRCYTDLLATYNNDNTPSTKSESERKAKIVTSTINSEQCRAMFANIRTTVKPQTNGSLSKIQVPRHRNTTEYPEIYQDFLSHTSKDDIVWDSLLDQSAIDKNLLRFNRQHFRAAAVSPCGHGTIHDQLTFTSLSPAAKALLEGTIPPDWYGNDELLREFLTSSIIPDSTKHLPPIDTSIANSDVHKGFSQWKEKTSTSPSGRHLGHYKAIIQNETLLTCLTKFLNLILEKGLVLTRWCNAVNIMIEKDNGQPKITRLCIIHLFEADLNFFLKLQWGSRLVRRADTHNLLNDGQHGSVPRRTAMDPIMLTELTTDLCRQLKHNLARFDNDASACYDRIIVALGMLAARRCGMPEQSVNTHATCLQHMRYSVKTQHGISDDAYQGTLQSPVFGTGQGSGTSPAVWLTIVVTLMNTMDRLITPRMNFSSPDTTQRHSRLIDAFVDDTSLAFTDSTGSQMLQNLTDSLANIAQTSKGVKTKYHS